MAPIRASIHITNTGQLRCENLCKEWLDCSKPYSYHVKTCQCALQLSVQRQWFEDTKLARWMTVIQK